MAPPKKPMIEKLANYKVDPATGCWLWKGSRTPRGYGAVKSDDGKKNVQTHRASYALKYGPVPEGMHVCHHCDVPSCINPDHLFLSDHTGNMRDAMRKGRHNGAAQRAKTHCKQGHRFTESNTKYGRKGNRICRACDVLRARLRIGWSLEKAIGTPNKWAEA